MYSPQGNDIWVPLGIQAPPIYFDDSIPALTYGSLGMVLGHEMTHGFDNMGSQFDKYGNYQNWWSNDTKTQFVDKYQCFIEQYSNFSFPALSEKMSILSIMSLNIQKLKITCILCARRLSSN